MSGLKGGPFEQLEKWRNITLDPIEAGRMFVEPPLNEEQKHQLDRWRVDYAAAMRRDDGRPPTKSELARLPVSKKFSAPRWHSGGDNPVDNWDEKISVWKGPYEDIYVPGHPRHGDCHYRRGCWCHGLARNFDWSKPCLYRRLK